MKQDVIEAEEMSYAPCRYGGSRTLFRGPRRRLDSPYLAFVGGSATYGRFIEHPFPALVEAAIGKTCVNLGCMNGGIDTFVNDAKILSICKQSDLTVVQILGANFLSNRFFTVHPRRNDQLLTVSSVLRAIYREVDFSKFTLTRHMLGALYDTAPDRFGIVVSEMRNAWLARMKQFLAQIGRDVVLLWFSETELSDVHWSAHPKHLAADPLFVTRAMVDELRPMIDDIVNVTLSDGALASGTSRMIFSASQTEAASQMLSVACHKEVSAAMIRILWKKQRAQ